ncbi:MAG: hypothetical protein QOE60_1754 [Thermoleophilaceae bacterium]|nr:hypothetical protein [Thermoleophilaceae bacterium]
MLALVAVAAVAAGGAAAVTGGVQDEDSAQPRQGACDRFASPRGHRSVQRLVNSLRPGEVGCLRKGTYRGALSIRRGGTPGHPITLQPRPGESARILGPIVVTGRASHVVVRRLYLNGRNRSESPSPIVNGQRILFADNDVTNDHTAICFALGNYRFGVARHVTLQRNRVHDCGTLPATNLEQGVYVAIARDTRVIGNWIYANADQGVQLYPDARRTRVVGNVIDSNGEGIIFGGSGRLAASDNLVEGNVISNSTLRDNVEASFDGPLGSGNLLRRNCIGGGARDDGLGGIISPVFGFSAIDNLVAAPAFKGAGSSDYRLVAGSPCVRVFRGDPNRVPGPGLPPPGG